MSKYNISVKTNGAYAFHVYHSPSEGEAVNGIVIETPNKLVVVDALLLKSASREFRAYIDGLGKPIDRVIITHSHPDHWCGLHQFTDVPSYALADTMAQITQRGKVYLHHKRAQLGEEIPSVVVPPTRLLSEGREQIDGLDFRFGRVVDTEAEELLTIELPRLGLFLAQDLVYAGVHMYVAEKNLAGELNFDRWIAELQRINERKYKTIIAGHGRSFSPTIIPEVIDYIAFARDSYRTSQNAADFKQRMLAQYPDYQAPEMIDISFAHFSVPPKASLNYNN